MELQYLSFVAKIEVAHSGVLRSERQDSSSCFLLASCSYRTILPSGLLLKLLEPIVAHIKVQIYLSNTFHNLQIRHF